MYYQKILLSFLALLLAASCTKPLSQANNSDTDHIHKQVATVDKSIYVAIYELISQSDSLTSIKKSTLFRLTFSIDSSVFESQRNHAHDSLSTVDATPVSSEQLQLAINKIKAIGVNDFPYIVFKNHLSGQITTYERIGTPSYVYKESQEAFKWQLKNTQQTIAGYKCQLAEVHYAGRLFKAWFTRDIPISDGPYKFCGLPGLIIDLSDTQGYYHFQIQKVFTHKENISIKLPPKRKVISTTREKVLSGRRIFESSYAERRGAMGDNLSEEDKVHSKELSRRRNNPLELK